MTAAKKLNSSPLVLFIPSVADGSTISRLISELPNSSTVTEVHLDFTQTSRIEKSFYQTLHKLKKDLQAHGCELKSFNLSVSLRNQFVDHGAYAFLNYSSPSKKSLLDVNFIQPFIDSTLKVLEVQTNIKSTMQKPYVKNSNSLQERIDIAGVISVVSDTFIGTIALCFPKQTFLKICFNLFGEEQTEITKDTEDAAAEILNMIFGGAKAELNKKNNYGIQKALPTIIRGDSLQVSQSTGTTMILPFSSDSGNFHIEIEIVSKD